jgi:serine/threonine protein kinase
MSVASGTRIGVYEVQAAIGAGGMGEVYRARDTRTRWSWSWSKVRHSRSESLKA